ncbi:stage II sporulation protein E [Sporomusa acidovorans]|uniref:Stage II sporulation protein E n=1 Tax=Sporomusa acidovorans (strain ATCC 49682 / DSM 3132 / Mol) TaxID=1123286 RepID=A0ABZ3IWJ9_SPOA4|nr:stage II sporulation protein E [Sporomusa acidovorans]OZC23686.1 stage II sporulation protein E [Sporomusa acidovorans DSM 3132]SDE25185.1 stage II sporulation protein E [Sporomusa acidovorans]
MPKVSVITLPEEVLQAPPAKPPVATVEEDKPGFPWQVFFDWVGVGGKSLFHQQNLPLNVLAFFMGRVSLLGEMAPFGLALFAAVASLARERTAVVGIWALAGVLSAGFYQEGVIYLLSMLLYWRFSDRLTRYETKTQTIPLFLFACILVSGTALLPWRDSTLYSMMLVAIEATLCMTLIFIFRYGAPLFLVRDKDEQTGAENLLCGTIMLATAVAGFGNLTLFDYSLRNIAGSLVAMTLAFSGGSGVGTTVGVIIGLVIGLNDGDAAAAIAMYALAGMIGGLFREMGKPAVLLGFILGSAIAVLYLGQPSQLLLALVEASVAGAAFMLVPVGKIGRWREMSLEADSSVAAQRAIHAAVDKLENMSEIFGDLAGTFGTGSTEESTAYDTKIKEAQLAEMLSRVGEKVCGPCTQRDGCWDRNFYQTYQAMLDMLAMAEGGNLKDATMPAMMKDSCIHRQALFDQIKQVADSNRTNRYWHKKLGECRQVALEQMQATGTIIGNLAQELRKGPQTDAEVAEMLTERAAALGCPLAGIRVTSERSKVMVEAQKTVCNGTRECVNTILPITANLLQEKMTLHATCGNKIRHKNCRLTMELDERYQIETGMATAAKNTGDACGDTCVVQPLARGRTALILSDGMGSGKNAANSSRQAVKFLQKLLTAGFEVDTAIKTVNSMLLIKIPGDTFATIDMAVVDTFTGETEFLKIGSAPSYIKRVREVTIINPASPPIGILEHIEIEPVRRVLAPGDIVVMVSDGVTDVVHGADRENWIANLLRRIGSDRPQDIADRLLRQAIELSGGVTKDDMAVLVARVTERPDLVQ